MWMSVFRRAASVYEVTMGARVAAVKLQVVGAVVVSIILGIVSHQHLVDAKQLTLSSVIWAEVWLVALGVFLFGLWRAGRITDSEADLVTEGSLQGRLFPPLVEGGTTFPARRLGPVLSGHRCRWHHLRRLS